MYELVKEASQVLREPPPEFDFKNPPEDPKEIEKNMAEAMEKFGGIGLSANQVGLPYKMFVMKTADKGTVGFFNGKITRASQETEMMKEGCLTFPFVFLSITRPRKVVVKYEDENGDLKEGHLDGMFSRIFQHEHDHTLGRTFVEGVSKMKLDRAHENAEKDMARMEKYRKEQKSA